MLDTLNIQNSMLPTLIHPVARALRLYGVDAQALFIEVGIDSSATGVPTQRIPQSRFSALMGRAVELTGDEAFGLAAARQLQPQILLALGLSWLASDTVYDGLRRMVRFARCLSTGVEIHLEEEGELLHAWLYGSLYPPRPVFAGRDYGIGIVMQMCVHTLGEELRAVEARLARPAPHNPEPWQRMFGPAVRFDSADTRVTWRLADVEQPLVSGDPALARVTDERAQAYLDNLLSNSLTRDVANIIIQELPDGAPAQDRVAQALKLSSRTLQRRLAHENTTFSELVSEARLELARAYLGQQGKSVVETAYLLGYSEPSTFSRAFKSWTGQSPVQYCAAYR